MYFYFVCADDIRVAAGYFDFVCAHDDGVADVNFYFVCAAFYSVAVGGFFFYFAFVFCFTVKVWEGVADVIFDLYLPIWCTFFVESVDVFAAGVCLFGAAFMGASCGFGDIRVAVVHVI